uniref:Metal-dependent hydrolase n=1 Tax=Fundidesulfovibrio putealis TaxID=270496 RepID=A0A7C4AC32_9BACT
MPGYKGHVTGAVVAAGAALGGAWWLGLYKPRPEVAVLLVAVSILGGLFPDVDTSSKGRHLYYGAALIADVVLILREQYRMAALLGFCALLPAIGSHRGWTHTWWAALIIPSPVLIAPMILFATPWQAMVPYYLAAVTGYFSHLVLDGTY